jgi:hypothetical protein
MTTPKKPTAAVQALIDAAVADATSQATQGLVVAASKPEHIKALTKTWRKSAEHLAAQIERFIILTVLAAIPSLSSLLLGGKFDWHTLLAFIGPFAYTAYRQVVPQMSAASVDSAPGATIVPDQVGAPTIDAPLPPDATVQVDVTSAVDAAPSADQAAAPPAPGGDAAP